MFYGSKLVRINENNIMIYVKEVSRSCSPGVIISATTSLVTSMNKLSKQLLVEVNVDTGELTHRSRISVDANRKYDVKTVSKDIGDPEIILLMLSAITCVNSTKDLTHIEEVYRGMSNVIKDLNDRGYRKD